MKTKHLLFCLLGAMVLTNVAYAEVNFGKQVPSADDVIKALDPSNANPDAVPETVKSRSIDMSRLKAPSKTAKKPPIGTTHAGGTMTASAAKTGPAALSLEIIFGYNSAELTDAAMKQLKPVGEALASGKLSNLSFVVEGHTDAVGSDSYNRSLSEERAASVKAFLVNRFGVSATQIQIIGKGKSDLLDPAHPDSEVNRRVRIIARK